MSQTKKSIFSITCDRLNQCIKQKKAFPEIGGLNLNTSAQHFGSALDLFPGIELNKACTAKPGMKQLTILYNRLEVANIDNFKAEKAEELIAFATSIATLRKARLNVVMPIIRRKSLQSFLQKRKDRFNSNAPYKQDAYDEKAWLRLSL